MRLLAVVGASPGIGKSLLCRSLTELLARSGSTVDHFAEEHVLTHPAFARVAADRRWSSSWTEMPGSRSIAPRPGRGPDWLRWYAAKLARYALIAESEPDIARLGEYLSHERVVTLRVLRRQPWTLLVVDHADTTTADDVLAIVYGAVTRFFGTAATNHDL